MTCQPRSCVSRSKVRKPRDRQQDLAGPGSRKPGVGNRNHVGANGLTSEQTNGNSKLTREQKPGHRHRYKYPGIGVPNQKPGQLRDKSCPSAGTSASVGTTVR